MARAGRGRGLPALILATFNRADPGWSHSAAVERIHNAGGHAGAWVADLMLYLFGVSAWWWVVLLVYAVIWGYRRLDGSSISDRRPFIIALAGFSMLLVVLVRARGASVPLDPGEPAARPGGLFGAVIGQVFHATFGFTGATLLLLAMGAIGLSLFTGVSWIELMEASAAPAEWAWFKTIELVAAARGPQGRRDRRGEARDRRRGREEAGRGPRADSDRGAGRGRFRSPSG